MSQINGIVPQFDESVQGFILRVMLRNGARNFKTIVTKGGWGSSPSVPYDAKHYFSVFETSLLMKIFEQQFYLNKSYSLFNDRLSHLESFENTFFPKEKKTFCGGWRSLRFCQFCIESQLYEKGFSYFKSNWLYNTFCEIHYVALYAIKQYTSVVNVVKSLKSILNAAWEEVNYLVTPLLSRCEDYKVSQSESNREDRALSFSECAKKRLVEYFLKTSEYYPEGSFSIVDYGVISSSQRVNYLKMNRRLQCKLNLEKIYQYEIEQNYDSLTNFLFNSLNFTSVESFGAEFLLIKSKNRNCSSCFKEKIEEFKSCSVSRIILISDFGTNSKENPCDFSLVKLKSDIKFHQELQELFASLAAS